MRDYEQSVRGYRIQGDPPKPDKRFSIDPIRPKTDAVRNLTTATDEADPKCKNNPEPWTSDDLPTDREAQLMCSGCYFLTQCGETAEREHMAWGVWGGRVYGRALKEAMGDG